MNAQTGLWTLAPAKINWTLEVLGRRSDGYHEIRSVMQTISLADTLAVRHGPAQSLQVIGPAGHNLAEESADQNLVVRAARVYPNASNQRPVGFTLEKRIPVAAGLGGGSSDAAAALRLLARVWNPSNRAALRRVASQLGSDVPFFLRGGAQLVSGRGDQLTPLPTGKRTFVVVLTPPLTVPRKTARLYAELQPAHFSEGKASERLAAKLRDGGAADGDDYVNVFDLVADQVFPWLADYRRLLEQATGARALLAGAGPSLYAVVPGDRPLTPQNIALDGAGLTAAVVHTIGPRAATRIEAL
jgi:4-diphosphocytidyl-2-C-methyl-D-erythritol kinase